MSYSQDKETEELDKLYPTGSDERRVLDYSRATHIQDEVPPLLLAAFKLLMGITAVMGVVFLIGLLSH